MLDTTIDDESDQGAHRRRVQVRHVPGEPLATAKPTVDEVMDTDTGQHVLTRQLFGTDYPVFMRMRMKVQLGMRKGEPLYVCSKCGVAVHICRHPDRPQFFFKHQHEDGNCPAVTKGVPSRPEIDARKFNGAKESRLHKRMKDWLVECMTVDGRFANVEKEPTWKGVLTGTRRRPDVRAVYNGLPIAFEVQLSTTYLDVIAARRDFYQENGGLLIWVFAQFDSEYRRMTDDDVFYNNNSNVFVVNADSVNASRAAREFKLECVWSTPLLMGGESSLKRQLVSFHELVLDPSRQWAYFYDCAGDLSSQIAARDALPIALRADLEAWWLAAGVRSPTANEDWAAFQARLSALGVSAPLSLSYVPKTTIKSLYSAKYGKPVADNRGTLLDIAHGVQKRDLVWFSLALRRFKRGPLLNELDRKTLKWKSKVLKARDLRMKEPEQFLPRIEWKGLIEFLFPELAPLPLS